MQGRCHWNLEEWKINPWWEDLDWLLGGGEIWARLQSMEGFSSGKNQGKRSLQKQRWEGECQGVGTGECCLQAASMNKDITTSQESGSHSWRVHPCFSTFMCRSLGILLKYSFWCSKSGVGTWNSAFLINSWAMLMLLVCGPLWAIGNHWGF